MRCMITMVDIMLPPDSLFWDFHLRPYTADGPLSLSIFLLPPARTIGDPVASRKGNFLPMISPCLQARTPRVAAACPLPRSLPIPCPVIVRNALRLPRTRCVETRGFEFASSRMLCTRSKTPSEDVLKTASGCSTCSRMATIPRHPLPTILYSTATTTVRDLPVPAFCFHGHLEPVAATVKKSSASL